MKIKINDRTVEIDRRDYNRDAVTRKHTAFESFHDLVNAAGLYRPSIYLGGKNPKCQRELLFLTFKYNTYQKARGDGRRVHKFREIDEDGLVLRFGKAENLMVTVPPRDRASGFAAPSTSAGGCCRC